MSVAELYEHIDTFAAAVNLSGREVAALRVAVPRVLDSQASSGGQQQQVQVFHVEELKAVAWVILRHLRVCSNLYAMVMNEGEDELDGGMN
eukprot:GDKK01019027.1.p1 GENE.GDKK01019027.1~~GDKK01019027.1.p1  ORF type:complete len:106 (-),score=30.02 GDKK01019027.1:13-285(-)